MDINRTCWKITSTFDYDQDTNPFDWGIEQGVPPALGQFLYDLILKESLKELKKEKKNLTEREKGILEETTFAVYQIPFAFGYVIGQMFDIPSPELQEAIKKIKGILKGKALLPYLPKERREP
jgi:hypothetical protein